MGKAILAVRRLSSDDRGGNQLAIAAGVHGVYVRNAFAGGLRDGLMLVVDGVDSGVAWFGPRGNLVLITTERCLGLEQAIAAEVRACQWTWRIAMGPAAVVDALGAQLSSPPLVCRDQSYYAGVAADATAALLRSDMREPLPADRERLARATLALNASDLNIAPVRVDRRWLYDTIDDRIADGSTRVIGPPGGLWCKLDFGSQGPGGLVIEGVFTFPERRGRGLCAELVASCLKAASGPVSLHVAESNRSARSAYERAGMREVGSCRLLLVG